MVNNERIAPGSASIATIWTTFARSSASGDKESLSKNREKKCRTRVLDRSFIAQGYQWIHARRTACRQIARQHGCSCQQREHAEVGLNIGWRHADEKPSQRDADGQAQSKTDDETNSSQGETFFQYGLQNLL